MTLQNRFFGEKLRLQVLNFSAHFVPFGSLWEITHSERHQHHEGNKTGERPVQGNPNRAHNLGTLLQETVAHLDQHLTTEDRVVTQLFFDSQQLVVLGYTIGAA